MVRSIHRHFPCLQQMYALQDLVYYQHIGGTLKDTLTIRQVQDLSLHPDAGKLRTIARVT